MKKRVNRLLNRLKYRYGWLHVYNSPFIRLKWKIKWSKNIKYGTPFFLPRRWVVDKQTKSKSSHPIKRFGINYWSLGWKTKWNDTDIRFEYGPGWSIVLFGTQIIIYPFIKEENLAIDSYWEAFLIYHYHTDKSKSKEERLLQCFDLYKAIWTIDNQTINYYNYILKDKYKHFIKK